MNWLIISTSCICLLFIYLFVVQYRRNRKLEDIANIVLHNMQTISDYIKSSEVLMSNPQLVEAFSEDDEVGLFFRNLKEIQETLNQFVLPGEEESNGGEL